MKRVKIKQTDESRNTTTTLADDGELTVALDASTTYFIDITLTFTAGATGDFKYAYVYTGTLTNALTFEGSEVVSPLNSGSGDGLGPCYNLGGVNFTTPTVRARGGNNTAGTVGGGHIRGVLITNSSGNLKIQWAQNTSDGADSTLKAGSYIAIAKQADVDGTLIIKGSDTSRSNTAVLAADPDLQFPTKANSKYIYELFVVEYSTSATPDIKFALHDANASQTLAHVNNVVLQGTGVFAGTGEVAIQGQFRNAAWVTTPTSGAFATSTLANKNHHHLHGSHVMSGSAGTFAWEWAQNVSNGTATVVVAPSWLLYEEIFQP